MLESDIGQIDLTDKGFCIFGLPDGGKSTLANFILKSYGPRGFVYDTLDEFPDNPFDRYAPQGRYDILELDRVVRSLITSRKYNLVIIDEANRFCPSKPTPLPQAVADLNDWRCHYGIAVGYIARRPVQLNQDLTELSHYLFIFGLKGKNDISYLNDLAAGLGDQVCQLSPYQFVVVDPQRNFTVYNPVPVECATDKKRGLKGLGVVMPDHK